MALVAFARMILISTMNVRAAVNDAVSVGALQRGLMVLQTLQGARGPLALPALADATGLDPSSIYRTLKVLTDTGYALRLPNKTYMVGPCLLVPVGFDHPIAALRQDAHGNLVELAADTQMTATLILLLGERRLALDVVLGRDRLVPHFSADIRGPLHSTASGRLMLWSLLPERREALLGAPPYESFGPNTLVSPGDLAKALAAADRDGYVWTRDETLIGVTGIAAPLKSQGAICGGLGLYGPSGRFDDPAVRKAGERLKQAAHVLSRTSGALALIRSMVGP